MVFLDDLRGSIDPLKQMMQDRRNRLSYAAVMERDDQDMRPASLNER